MSRTRWISAAAALVFCTALSASPAGAIGSRIAPFQVAAMDGREISWTPGAVTVVLFLSAECPVSRDYEDRLAALHRELDGRPVRWLAIAPNTNESNEQVSRMASDASLPFPLLRDPGLRAVAALGITKTPAAIVLDPGGIVRYRGAVDDARYSPRVKRRYLKEAVDSLLSGRRVEHPEGWGLGCAIKRR